MGAIAEQAWKLLRYQENRDAAQVLAAEIARMPSPDDVARELRQWAEAGSP